MKIRMLYNHHFFFHEITHFLNYHHPGKFAGDIIPCPLTLLYFPRMITYQQQWYTYHWWCPPVSWFIKLARYHKHPGYWSSKPYSYWGYIMFYPNNYGAYTSYNHGCSHFYSHVRIRRSTGHSCRPARPPQTGIPSVISTDRHNNDNEW